MGKIRGVLYRIPLLWMCLLMITSAQPFYLVSNAAEKTEREIVKVGFFAFDGYHMINESGERSGYGYDFLRLASRYLDVDYEYIGYDEGWDDMLEMLRDGRIDLVTSAQSTVERLREFAFSKAIGSSSAMLTTTYDNHEVVAGDYPTYDGMQIGLLKGNSRNMDLEEFAQKRGFSYQPVYFDLYTELEQALQTGQVDAILTSSLRETQQERLLDLFAADEFYVIVRKEDTRLLEKINYAIDQINATEGDWKNNLNNRYYEHLEEKTLSFTPEEQQLIWKYVSGEKKLVMTASMDRAPYSYVENGELKGIIPDYFARLAAYIGIPYETAVPGSREEYNAWRFDGTVDGFMDARIDSEQWMEEVSFSNSVPYTVMRLAMVTRRDFDGDIEKIAIASAQGLIGIEDGLAPNAERITVDSREEAMQMVLDGKADAAFVYLYTAQQFVNQDERGLMTYTMLEAPTYDYHVAFTDQVTHELSGIFTKAIYAMPTGTFEDIASQYTSYKAKDVNLMTWIKIHPIPTLGIGAGLLLMILMVVQLYERQKAVKKEQERSAQLQELAAMAESASHAKTMFLNNMSHDIRTPMNAIIGFTSLAASHLDNPQQVKEYLQKISVSSEHLLSLINDVLDMSCIESGKVKIDEQPLHLPDLLQDIRTIVQPTIRSKQVEFVIDTMDVRDENIIADKLRLNQILLNILSNGIKFNKIGGMVSLQIRQLHHAPMGYASYQFIIRDTGIGMKPEFVEHIFDAFAREETATVSGIPGTGLGMAITKNIVDMMGGTISVESQVGIGSEFVVSFLFKLSGEPAAQTEEPVKRQPVDFSGKRILLVEDNQLNQEILVTLLEEMGLCVETADDGSVAVERVKLAEHGQYDLILMDIQMPFMDGYEATRKIRSLEDPILASIPIIAMTANAFASDWEKAMASGMNGYLTKPVNIKKMAEVLSDVLQQGNTI